MFIMGKHSVQPPAYASHEQRIVVELKKTFPLSDHVYDGITGESPSFMFFQLTATEGTRFDVPRCETLLSEYAEKIAVIDGAYWSMYDGSDDMATVTLRLIEEYKPSVIPLLTVISPTEAVVIDTNSPYKTTVPYAFKNELTIKIPAWLKNGTLAWDDDLKLAWMDVAWSYSISEMKRETWLRWMRAMATMVDVA